MENRILSLLFILSFYNLFSQNPTFEWATSTGGSGNDYGESIKVDNAGNVYVTGTFDDTVDFDPGSGVFNLISKGNTDVFIQKLDANGNLIWAKSFGSSASDYSVSINIDSNGEIIVSGGLGDTTDMDPGTGIFNLNAGPFLQKLDANGNFLWAITTQGATTGGSTIYSTIIDVNNNIINTGTFVGTVDFDPGTGVLNLTGIGSNIDVFIQKLDANGNFIWAKAINSSNNNSSFSVATDANNNVLTTGYYGGTCDFDPGTGVFNLSSSSTEIFILKLDQNGNFIWAKSVGGSGVDYGKAITTDLNNNVLVTGFFRNTADFDPGTGVYNLTSLGNTDIFALKLSPNGNFLWAIAEGSNGFNSGNSITTDNNNNVYLTGDFSGTVDFDPSNGIDTLLPIGSSDIFIQKLDSLGVYQWAKSVGSIGSDLGVDITANSGGNVYITGNYNGTTDFDIDTSVFNLTPINGKDYFVLKLSQCIAVTYGIDTQNACFSYTWIDGVTYTSSNNSATFSLTNAAGCDSIITLNLTIDTVDITVTNNSPILQANATNATF